MSNLFKKIAAGLSVALLSVATLTATAPAANAAPALSTIKLDYAYWNPLSLLIKDKGWAEAEFKKTNTKVEWVYSASSAAALQSLNAKAIDVASSAGAPAYTARANGASLKTIGVFSQPKWASIVVTKSSPIAKVEQLKGKKIAAASGTDPYFHLLLALDSVGLSSKDVTIVNLPHADGQKALVAGQVDAWAGLDPLTAQAEQNSGVKIIYSNAKFNSWGVLSANEDTIKNYPTQLVTVLKLYEKARAFTLDNGSDVVDILAKASNIKTSEAKKVLLNRTKINVSIIPGATQAAILKSITPVLVEEARIKSADAATKALASLYDASLAKKAVKK